MLFHVKMPISVSHNIFLAVSCQFSTKHALSVIHNCTLQLYLNFFLTFKITVIVLSIMIQMLDTSVKL